MQNKQPCCCHEGNQILYPCLTSSIKQRGTSDFILKTIVATSSQVAFKDQLLNLMLANTINKMNTVFSASVSDIKTHCFQDLWVMNQKSLSL